ncbi:hypothetical protein [Candidatus Thiodiazotropha sp. CDECU1]|uniref:hypothetical protein n=1 Tax=Candidatus Thiodiazotropha sp. CDECU1 TaxID=3065865 RepID=UPI00292F4148|nr:hypothetical protein [Candidatus Thiodiazotropha sp. CDECU1]
MPLKPQDILVLLKLVTLGDQSWSYNRLAIELGMSPSEVHGAVKRVLKAQLAVHIDRVIQPNFRNLEEFLIHGIRYAFVPERGEMTRGMPTAHAAPPLSDRIVPDQEPPPVWPDPEGEARGMIFSPLYRSAPVASRNDPALYELLALVDAIRGGKARERSIAAKELTRRFNRYEKEAKPKPKHSHSGRRAAGSTK